MERDRHVVRVPSRAALSPDLLVLCSCSYAARADWTGLYRLRLRQVQARFAAVLAERNRIAREIHDTLAQGFTGISVQLESVAEMMGDSQKEARAHLDRAEVWRAGVLRKRGARFGTCDRRRLKLATCQRRYRALPGK
jgi:signal transduction histidine kinase